MKILIRLVWIFSFTIIGAIPVWSEATFTVTFINKSGYPNSQVYLYITGDEGDTHGYLDFNTQSYVVPRISSVTDMTATLESLGGSGPVTISIPAIGGGRIYFSYGADFNTLSFDSVSGQPGYGPEDLLLYDKVEFTSNVPGQLNMNSTNVDFFSLPFTFEAVDKNTGKRVRYGYQVSRDIIFDSFSEIPRTPPEQEFGNTAIYRDNLVQVSDGTSWRVITPDKVTTPNEAEPDPASGDWHGNFKLFSFFWHDYIINRCWVPDRTITLNYNAVTYTGTVDGSGDTLSWDNGGGSFHRPAYNTTLPEPPPTGANIDANYGHIIFGGAGEFVSGILAPIINSAIQRGVMHLDGSEWNDESSFYQGTNLPDSPVNHYGKILHHYAINHDCYAISYDDGFGYNTSIFVNPGDNYTVTLLPLSGAGRAPWIHDYNGDGTSDIGIFRGSNGLWAIRGTTRIYFGTGDDLPVPGDYTGDGTTNTAVFRSASGLWAVRGVTRLYFGGGGDLVVPGDYNGDGTTDPAVFRSTSGLWAVRGITRTYFGGTSDTPVPGWYGGGTTDEIAIYRPASGLWAVRATSRIYFGGVNDTPKSGNYNGDGVWDYGIYRAVNGLWAIRGITRFYFGGATDQAVPADYRGTGRDDPAVFRAASGLWAIRNMTRIYFGSPGDVIVTR